MAEDLCVRLGCALRTGAAVRDYGLDIARFLDMQRDQVNSSALLGAIEELYPRTNGMPRHKVLAVVAEDLYIPVLTHVFGEARLGGDFAVVSTHRLQNERYGLPEDPELTFRRLVKESLHELGHAYGLTHCQDFGCLMRASSSVEEIDLKGDTFCPSCQQSLRFPK
jgi:archaemetzincin